MVKRKGYIAPVQFREDEIPDEEERKAMNDGLNVMVRSTLDLVERCIAQRQKQFIEIMRERE